MTDVFQSRPKKVVLTDGEADAIIRESAASTVRLVQIQDRQGPRLQFCEAFYSDDDALIGFERWVIPNVDSLDPGNVALPPVLLEYVCEALTAYTKPILCGDTGEEIEPAPHTEETLAKEIARWIHIR